MNFLSLTRGHVIAGVAALALLLFMAVDWYSTEAGREARRIADIQAEDPAPEGNIAAEAEREVIEDARLQAEEAERNAWQASGFVSRVALVLMLGAILLALGAAALRAAGRRYEPPLSPAALAAVPAAVAAVLILLQIAFVGAARSGGVVEIGAPLGLTACAALAVGALLAARAESREAAGSLTAGEPAAHT
jgi:hypothetical protein